MKRNMQSLTLCIVILSTLPLLAQGGKEVQVRAMGGVFSPGDDEIQNIYGDGSIGKIGLATSVGETGMIAFGANFYRNHGDPFYADDDFNAGDAGRLTMTDLSITLSSHILTRTYPKIHFGAGVDYVIVEERITGQQNSDGSAIGGHISVMPEFRIGKKLSLLFEASYRLAEITFENDISRYKFDLSGANLLVGLGYVF